MIEEVTVLVIGVGILIALLNYLARRQGKTETEADARPIVLPPAEADRGPVSPPRRGRPIDVRPAAQPRAITLGPPRSVRLPDELARPGVRRGPALVIPRRHAPLWREKGWRANGRVYEGVYRAAGREWRGRIREAYPGSFDAYIWDPPLAQLSRRTIHRPCFQGTGRNGLYKIHFHTMPEGLDHAIVGIEAVLAEAMGVR